MLPYVVGGSSQGAHRASALRTGRVAAVALVLLAFAFGAAPPGASAATVSRDAAAPAGASGRTASRDAAATRAYLLATVSFQETELANLPRTTAALQASAAQISGECPGVLTNSPPPEAQLFSVGLESPGGESQASLSARARGERNRQSRQRADLQEELLFALESSQGQPERQATETLVHALTPLSWSNPKITSLLALQLAVIKNELEAPTPAVCADMKAWVASGYRTLPPAAKEAAGHTESLLKLVFVALALSTETHIQPFPQNLAPYENAQDRALVKRSEAISSQLKRASKTQTEVRKHLEAAVGLPVPKPQRKLLPEPKKPPVVARGRTAAGGKFVVRAERRAGRPDPIGCSAFVTIEEPSRPQPGLLEILNSEGTGRCLSRSHIEPEPAVHCNAGLLTVEANLLPSTQSVRLLVSDGSTITSPAIRIPARLGGPAGFYYQAVRGPSPIPVSLTELNASGDTLAVLKLPAVVECTKHPVKYVPKGIVELAHASLPQGPSFTIRGEAYRKLGVRHFELKLALSNEQLLFGSGSSFEASVEGPEIGNGVFDPNTQAFGTGGQAFASQASSGCQPQPYAIVYGLLKDPRDTVLARVSGTLIPLHEVAIPARLHAGGLLAYGAFSPLPTELLLRGPSGKTLDSKNLSRAATEASETCEGEAE
jgi:hypothetical protein